MTYTTTKMWACNTDTSPNTIEEIILKLNWDWKWDWNLQGAVLNCVRHVIQSMISSTSDVLMIGNPYQGYLQYSRCLSPSSSDTRLQYLRPTKENRITSYIFRDNKIYFYVHLIQQIQQRQYFYETPIRPDLCAKTIPCTL